MSKLKNEEVKDMSNENRLLDDDNRARICDQLSDLGVPDPTLLSDSDLVLKLSTIMEETHKKNITLEASKAIKPLNMYAAKSHSDLKNKEFIARLFNLNIPDIFLAAFTDDDASITADNKLWEIVHRSGIYQYEHPRELFKKKTINRHPPRRDIPREYRK
jgi:hypothetical protein